MGSAVDAHPHVGLPGLHREGDREVRRHLPLVAPDSRRIDSSPIQFKVKEHPGDIFEFLNKKRLTTLREIERKDQTQKQEKKQEPKPEPKPETNTRQEQAVKETAPVVVTLPDNKQKYEEKKEADRIKRKIQTRIAKAEERIENLENRIHLIEMFLADPESMAANAGPDPYAEYEALKLELSQAMEEWEEAHNGA